ncbi:MAG: glycosyltransferase family 4 protein [Microscillaceae bacterium]|nr:glycosyltransferase family 4 protein [Microscillaceae bacterium]
MLIITTWELLRVGVWAKKKLGLRLVYDVQENYRANLQYGTAYPAWLKPLLINMLTRIEKKAHPYIDYYFLAEACYQEEMPEKEPAILLENKVRAISFPSLPSPILQNPAEPCFLLCGTLAPDYGLFRALEALARLATHLPRLSIELVGFAPQKWVRRKVRRWAAQHPFVQIVGLDLPVAYATILQAMQNCDYLLLPYIIHPGVAHRIPTKLFEGLAAQIPMLVQQNSYWQRYLEENNVGKAFFLDFEQPEALAQQWPAIQAFAFRPQGTAQGAIFWESQELLLEQVIRQLWDRSA